MVKQLVRRSSAALGTAALTAGLIGVLAMPASAAPPATPPGLYCSTWTSGSWPYFYANGQCTNYSFDGQIFTVKGTCSGSGAVKVSNATLVLPGNTETATTNGWCVWGFSSITIS
jgi:hypothetical protein